MPQSCKDLRLQHYLCERASLDAVPPFSKQKCCHVELKRPKLGLKKDKRRTCFAFLNPSTGHFSEEVEAVFPPIYDQTNTLNAFLWGSVEMGQREPQKLRKIYIVNLTLRHKIKVITDKFHFVHLFCFCQRGLTCFKSNLKWLFKDIT